MKPIGLAVLAVLCLTACGVTEQDEPHSVTLPRRALNGPPSAAATPGSGGEVAEVLCLVRDGGLRQVVRRIDAAPDPQRHLDDLLAGPDSAERGRGLSTALAGVDLAVRTPPGSAETSIEVTEADPDTGRSDEALGYAQIVCTLTTRADVNSVVFTRDGKVLRVPRADGTLSEGPLSASDYRSLIGPA